MKRTVILACLGLVLSFSSARAASAQMPAPGTARGIGIGMISMLSQDRTFAPSGLSFAYDAGSWHLDTLLSAFDSRGSKYALGARGWFHLHQSAGADFSIGGGLGIRKYDQRGDNPSSTSTHIDAGFLIRAFLTPNVALSAFGGLGIVPGGDGRDGFAFDGQLFGFGGGGLHYYFQ